MPRAKSLQFKCVKLSIYWKLFFFSNVAKLFFKKRSLVEETRKISLKLRVI